MNKCKVLWFDLRLQGLIFHLKVLICDLKIRSLGLRAQFVCLFSSLGTVRCFLLIEREGLDLKFRSFGVEGTIVCLFSSPVRCFLLVWKEGLDFECWSLRLRARLGTLVLFTQDLQLFPFCWKKRSWLGVFIFEFEGMLYACSLHSRSLVLFILF